jgi:enoyl-CoA hydratase/carnithine racemase
MTIETSVEDRVGWITLARPERRNAFDTQMRVDFADAVERHEQDPDVSVIAIIGTGTAFSAGADLKEAKPADAPHYLAQPRRRIAAPVEQATKPVLACINGAALGGGLELALAADLRIAAAGAVMGLTEVRVGSVPGSGGIQRLSRAVPQAVANRMLMTGRRIDADEALRIGLVSDVFPAEDFGRAARELAKEVAAGAPLALRAIKAAARHGGQAPIETAVVFDDLYWALVSTTEDWQAGRAAFREGRPPEYRGA